MTTTIPPLFPPPPLGAWHSLSLGKSGEMSRLVHLQCNLLSSIFSAQRVGPTASVLARLFKSAHVFLRVPTTFL